MASFITRRKLIGEKTTVRSRNFIIYVLLLCAFIIPCYISINIVLSGNIPFWYDPARDLSAAIANLHKVSLIGQTTGIPGLFYGPYWIWLLSVGLLLSKDPRLVLLFIITIPYLILFPLFLVRLFGRVNGTLLWLLFFFSVGSGTMTHLWNPVVSPLLLLMLIFIASRLLKVEKNSYTSIFSFGFLSGILIQFHMSLGVAICMGNLFFISVFNLKIKKPFTKKAIVGLIIKKNIIFFMGLIISFLPFIAFEVRHNFMQLKSVYKVFISGEEAIGITGMSKLEIIQTFLGRLEVLFRQPLWLITIAAALLIVIKLFRSKLVFSSYEKGISIYLISLLIIILSVYLSAKNPVWAYHFLGIEVIFLALVGLFMTKFPIARFILVSLLFLNILGFMKDYIETSQSDPLSHGSFYTKKYITETILKDAKSEKFTLYAYSPSIYVFEYAYLFNWLGKKNVPYDPSLNPSNSRIVYLIIPPSKNTSAIQDFIHYRSPPIKYKTVNTIRIPDGTIILKRLINE